jgi:branched-chain amino acid transport system substrate-binding protein
MAHNQEITRRTALRLGAAAAATLAGPAIVRAAGDQEIVLGVVVALTGPNGAWGQTAWDGFQLACELVNEQGGIKSMGGARLKPVVADTESKPTIAGSQAEKLIRQGAVVLVGTNQSPATTVATQVCERQGVSFICPADIDPLITSRGFKWTFRTCPLMDAYARDLLGYAKRLGEANGQPPKTVAVLSESSAPGKASIDAVKKALPATGMELVDVSTYDATTAQNFTSYIAKYKAAGVDVVVGHGRPNDRILIVRTMKELGYTPKFSGALLGGDSSREFIDTLGKDANGLYGTTGFARSLNLPELKMVIERYEKRFGKQIDSTAASEISSLSVIWDALERAKSADKKALRDAIAATELKLGEHYFIQANGLKFEPNGENGKAEAIVYMLQDGVPLTVAPEAFSAAKGVYPKAAWPA